MIAINLIGISRNRLKKPCSPKGALNIAGIDITCYAVCEDTLQYFYSILDEYENPAVNAS